MKLNYNKIFLNIIIALAVIFSATNTYAKDEKDSFQEIMKELLEVSGKVKSISQDLKPSSRLYIHQQLPTMFDTIKNCEKDIQQLRNRINSEILNEDLYGILSDTANLELLSIMVTKELLQIYSESGSITSVQYNKVVKKYEKDAEQLKKSLRKYKNM